MLWCQGQVLHHSWTGKDLLTPYFCRRLLIKPWIFSLNLLQWLNLCGWIRVKRYLIRTCEVSESLIIRCERLFTCGDGAMALVFATSFSLLCMCECAHIHIYVFVYVSSSLKQTQWYLYWLIQNLFHQAWLYRWFFNLIFICYQEDFITSFIS